MASAEVNFASVDGMYAKPVSGSSPAALDARNAFQPFVSLTSGAYVSIASFGSSVPRRSRTKRGQEGTRPSAFSAAERR